MNIFKDTISEMTYEQVENLVAQEAVVLLPIGIIEEHGPHLPLGTDIYLAYKQAHDVWEELNAMEIPCVIAPPFYLGGVQALTRHLLSAKKRSWHVSRNILKISTDLVSEEL